MLERWELAVRGLCYVDVELACLFKGRFGLTETCDFCQDIEIRQR